METETPWESPRKKEQKRKMAEYVIFDEMMKAVDDGDCSYEDAIKALEAK